MEVSTDQSQSLADWLCYLENIHPVNIDLGLERVGSVAEKLTLNQFSAKVITVAGTNGKGSTCAFLERILLQAGYRVGVSSSPHIQDYRERVRINGQMLPAQAHADSFAFIEQGRGDTSLTYFEFTTLSALKLFQDADLDVVILEVGLGGRLDAANIIAADVAVITTIDIDHSDWLGTDKNAIAREKAGIFRADQAAICGVLNPPPSIAEYAAELGTDLRSVNRDYFYTAEENSWVWHDEQIRLADLALPQLPLQNAATAIAAIRALPLTVSEQALRDGIKHARLAGRMQRIDSEASVGKVPQQYLDVAHNPESARYLAVQLAKFKPKRIIAVVGMLKDKDIVSSLAELSDVIDEWHIAALNCPRAAKLEQITDALATSGQTHDNIAKAWQFAVQNASCDDVIIGFGSFYTVAEILDYLNG